MRLRPVLLGSVVVVCLASCVYPRGRTPLSPAPASMLRAEFPKNLFQVVLVDADVPAKMRSGLPWDEAAGEELADPYLEIGLDNRVIWRSPTLRNSTSSRFDNTPSPNLRFDRDKVVSLALWDDDTVGHDPIGLYRGRVFANAALGDDIHVELEGGTKLTLRLNRPVPMSGTGIGTYEVHNDAIWILDVLPDSPAARGGLAKGDRIVSFDGASVRKLGLRAAEGRLAMAADDMVKLGVLRAGQKREVVLGAGPIWVGTGP